MRHFHLPIIILIAASVCSCVSGGHKSDFRGLYYFQPQSNESLYLDLLARCDTMIVETYGTPVSKQTKDFKNELIDAHKKDAYAWIGQTFNFVDLLKKEHRPVLAVVGSDDMEGIIRKNIMLLLDFPMHCDELSAIADPKVVEVYPHERNIHLLTTHESFMKWLGLPAPEPGEISVAKMYSSGLLFRTNKHCFGLDLRWQGDEDDAYKIATKCDAIVLTHCHDDHYSYNIFGTMAHFNRAVVVPDNYLFADFGGEEVYEWKVPYGEVINEVKLMDGIKVKARMSAQGDEPCLLYMIELDGWKIAAVGDNSHGKMEEIYSEWDAPDFICTPIFEGFQNIMGYVAKAPNPDGRKTYYLPHHENEMHHGVHARVGYRFLFNSPWALGSKNFEHYVPYVLLDGGEYMNFKK